MDEKAKKLWTKTTPEQAKKVMEKALWENDHVKAIRESIKTHCNGLDIKDPAKFPVSDPSFSIKKMKEKVMRESLSASTFPQLLRAGIQTAVNAAYQTITETTYEKWSHTIASDKDTELYAPLHGLTFLQESGPGEKYVESNVQGLDIKLKNKKFGEMFVLEHELSKDDQTGQMQQMVGYMAEYAKLLVEILCYGKLNSVSGTSYAGLSVPVSETKPSTEANYPWTTSSAPFVGGGFNKPASFAALAQDKIQNGIIALLQQKNLLGLKMMVQPTLLAISPHYQFDADVLMHSSQTPSGAQSAGVTGGAFAVNPLKNILEVVVSRFMFDNAGSSADSKAWYIMDGKRPWFINQMREPASVIMENPASGESFDRDLERYKLRVRCNADFIDPRFVWQGSDGSA